MEVEEGRRVGLAQGKTNYSNRMVCGKDRPFKALLRLASLLGSYLLYKKAAAFLGSRLKYTWSSSTKKNLFPHLLQFICRLSKFDSPRMNHL